MKNKRRSPLFHLNNGRMKTPWTDRAAKTQPLPEYPRPHLQRTEWLNLNGDWDLEITDLHSHFPENYSHIIKVPFCVESFLSRVERPVLPTERLWYHRQFSIPPSWGEKRIILHFGAVDWEATVYINDEKVGFHQGGYLPFRFDITDYLQSELNEIVVSVRDPTDSENHQRGKQSLHPKGIFYTPCSGIWQTVWLEPVSPYGIQTLTISPDIELNTVKIHYTPWTPSTSPLTVQISSSNSNISFEGDFHDNHVFIIYENPTLWCPDNPFLYQLHLIIKQGNEIIDELDSYFAFRKISVNRDGSGKLRLFLNDQPLFQMGILDQGYWPDGLFTAPSDAALRYDLEIIKKFGFNMVRKHVKIEPARWYYYCDQLGLIAWQDMVSGANSKLSQRDLLKVAMKGYLTDSDLTEEDYVRAGREEPKNRQEFEEELRNMLDTLNHFPSICVWVPFNEGWGQFDSDRIGKWIKSYDPNRLVDPVSGWNLQTPGEIRSWHTYVRKLRMLEPPSKLKDSALVISEFGGYILKIADHLWNPRKSSTGYGKSKSKDHLTAKYVALLRKQAFPLISNGLSGLIYTQLSDVETELNGLMTYDRQELKMDLDQVKAIHAELMQKSSDAFK